MNVRLCSVQYCETINILHNNSNAVKQFEIWKPTTSHWTKQPIWLRTAVCGGWCLHMVLHTPSGACQKRMPSFTCSINVKLLRINDPDYALCPCPTKVADKSIFSIMKILFYWFRIHRLIQIQTLYYTNFWLSFYYGRPMEYGRPLYFCPVVSSFFSSPNLSRRRLDVYHSSTHGVALVWI